MPFLNKSIPPGSPGHVHNDAGFIASMQTLFNNLPEMIWSVNKEKCLLTWNNSYAREYQIVTGQQPVAGIAPYEKFQPASIPFWSEKLDLALKGEVVRFGRSYVRNGVQKYSHNTFYPVLENGKVYSVTCISVDITEQKKILHSLIKSESRLKEAQRIAHIGNWELDIVRNELYWSEEIYRIFEKNPHSFKAKYEAFLDCIHPHDRAGVDDIYRTSIAEKSPYSIDHRLLFPDGRIKYVHEECKHYYDRKGNPTRSIGTVQDITELKKAELLLRKNEKRISELLDATPDAIVVINEGGKIIMINKQGCDLFKFEKEDIIHQSIDILVPAAVRYRHAQHRMTYTQSPKVRGMGASMDLEAVDKDGNHIPVEISLSPLLTDEGLLVSAGIRDITERKKAEKALQESYQSIRELTTYIQDIREEERTAVARDIHDELGQHLTVIKMDISWLERSLGKVDKKVELRLSEMKEMISTTIRSVRRICAKLRPSVLDDLGLAAAIEDHLREFGNRYGIITECSIKVSLDELSKNVVNTIFRIFQESLTNVARHAKAKHVSVELTKPTSGHLLLRIQDDGIGFDPNGLVSKKTLGVLGMKERAEDIGGEYIINSEPGKGTVTSLLVNYEREKKAI
jgi:PAS domain S-box-containing protein